MPFFYILSGVIFFLGVTNSLHIPPWNSFHSEIICAFSVLILFFGLSLKRDIYINDKLLLVILFFIFLFLVDEIILIYFSIYLTAYVCGNNLCIKKRYIDIFIFLLGGVLTVSLFVQFLDLTDIYSIFPASHSERRPGGFLMQSNHSATFVCMAIIAVVNNNCKTKFLLIFLVLMFLGVGVAITESRTAFVSLCVYIFYAVFNNKLKIYRGFSVLFLIGFCYLLIPFFYDFFYFNGATSLVRANLEGGRLNTWPILIDAIKENPIFGYGFNNVFAALDEQVRINPGLITEPFHYSHNLILDLFIWMGVPLAMVFLFFSCKILSKCFSKDNFNYSSLLIPIIVHSFFEYPYAYVYFGVIFFLLLGKVFYNSSQSFFLVDKRLMWIYCFFCLITIILYARFYLISEEIVRNMRFESIGVKNNNFKNDSSNILSNFNLDKEVFDIFISQDLMSEDLLKIENLSKKVPSINYQIKYAEALYVTGNCMLLTSQLGVIQSFYGRYQKYKTVDFLRQKYKENYYCDLF